MEKQEFKFTEAYIQKRLDRFFAISTQKYVLENLYVFDWESDKFIETRSGLIYEFEIKISRSDFKNDFKKADKHVILEGKEEFVPSYDKILDRWKPLHADCYRRERYKKPNYFYYAVPEGMIEAEEVPEYAGLIYVLPEDEWKTKDGKWCHDGYYVVKNAPKLHSTHYTDDELKLSEKFYWNMQSWKSKCREERDLRLMSEDAEHKIPYAELLTKYEKAEKECKAMKVLVNSESKKAEMFAETMETDMRIINGYRAKIREMDPDFNFIEFEDEFIDE